MSRELQNPSVLEAPLQKSGLRITWLEILVPILASVAGWLIVQNGFDSIVPVLLTLAGIVLAYIALNKPFPVAFSIYMALAAFNYYYFYCARFTGRNPGDIPGWGLPATPLEQMQKDIVFFLVLGLAVIKLFKGRMEGSPIWSGPLKHPIIKIIFLFAGFVGFNSIIWILEGEKVFHILHYVRNNIEYTLIPILMCTVLIKSEKHLNMIFRGMMYTMPVVALLGIIEVLIGGAIYERSFYGGEPFSRAVATLQNPNNLGAYLGTTLGVSILYYIYGQLKRYERWWFWPSVMLGLFCLFMTISRSSVLVFFIMITASTVIFSMASRGKKHPQQSKLVRNVAIGYGLLILCSAFVLIKFFDFSYAIKDAAEIYLDTRTSVSNARIFALVPVMNSLLASPLKVLFGYINSAQDASDNSFAEILFQGGILGFILYCSVVVLALAEGFRGVFREQHSRAHFYIISLFIIGSQILHSFSSLIYKAFPHNVYFWFVVGVLVWLRNHPAPASNIEPTEAIPPQTSRND